MKRLIVLSKNLLDKEDAQSQQTWALVDGLSRAGYQIEVITGGEKSHVGRYTLGNGIVAHVLPAIYPTKKNGLIDRMCRKLTRNILSFYPTNWAKAASGLAGKLLSENVFDGVVSIALPVESHTAAYLLRRKTGGGKWLAHFSDPWPESIMPKPYSAFSIPLLDYVQKKHVERIICDADVVTFTCREQLDFYLRHYRGLDKKMSYEVPHVALAPSPGGEFPKRSKGEVSVVHSGALSRERVSRELAQAIGRLPQDSNLKFYFYGFVHPKMVGYLEKYNAMHRVSICGWRPKKEISSIVGGADALLSIEAKMDEYPFLPSKMADYSVTGLPIIAVTGAGSPTARLLRQYNAGISVAHNADAILESLIRLEADYKSLGGKGLCEEFSEKNIVSLYDFIFDGFRLG